jgi:hypothetical protein
MAEESQENKKPGCCKRIFKWIGLGLLALLLIAGLIFQAPWKVITLLAIILAACTILPKPARKWFWLSAGIVVIALIIWVLLPEDDEGWRPYTFDEELAVLENKYAIPDEENAALAYDEIFQNLDIDANQPEFFLKSKPSSKDEPWLSKDHQETAEWLKGHQSTIEKLLQTAKNDKCRFLPIRVDAMGIGEYMERLPKIRQCAFLLVSAANNDLAEGRIDDGIEKYLCIIQMARHSYQQPVTIHQLVGFAIESIGLQQLNRFVIEGRPSEQQLQLLSSSLIGAENNWGADLCKILDFEKLYAKNMLCSMAYEKNAEGKVRLSRRTFASTIGQSPQQLTTGTYSRRKYAKLGVIFVWLYVPSAPEKIGEMFDASYAKYYAMTDPAFDWAREPQQLLSFLTPGNFRRIRFNYEYGTKLIADMSAESYYSIHDIYLKNLAFRRGSRLLIAIKQYSIEHGSWPANFNVIKSRVPAETFIDPVSGDEFEYENHGGRFSLYGETRNIWPK